MKVILFWRRYRRAYLPGAYHCRPNKKLRPDTQIIFVGTQQGLEKNIIPRYGYPLRYIEIAGFKRSLSFDTLRSFGKLFTGLIGANSLISEIKPDLVIGTGGYVCGPVVFLAALRGIPTAIQEQNAMPGVPIKFWHAL